MTQVLLSAAFVLRLNKLEQRILVGLSNQGEAPTDPPIVDNVSIDDDPRMGTDGAVITIVEFGDYECPFCAEASKSINEIMSEYKGKVLFVYRDFPLEQIHPNAFQAAEAANCAGQENAYWKMHDLLFANNTQLDINSLRKYANELGLNMEQFNSCLDSHKFGDEIRHDVEDGLKYQVSSTPTFFINGHRVVGASLEQLKATIDILIR